MITVEMANALRYIADNQPVDYEVAKDYFGSWIGVLAEERYIRDDGFRTKYHITDTGRLALEAYDAQDGASGDDAPSPDELIEAEILELQDENDALKARIAQLEAERADMRAVLAPVLASEQAVVTFRSDRKLYPMHQDDIKRHRLFAPATEITVAVVRAIAELARKLGDVTDE